MGKGEHRMKVKMLEELIGAKYKQTANRAMDMYYALWKFKEENNLYYDEANRYCIVHCSPNFSWSDFTNRDNNLLMPFASEQISEQAINKVMIPLMKKMGKGG